MQSRLILNKTTVLEMSKSNCIKNSLKIQMAKAKEICMCIYVNVMGRFSYIKHLVAAKLFDKKFS